MRVLVAAQVRPATSAPRAEAAVWALDGELVRPPASRCGDRRCACARQWAGLASGKTTQAARVVELDLQREGLLAAFVDALTGCEWPLDGDPDDADDLSPEWIVELVDQHLDLAGSQPLGALVWLTDGQHGDPLARSA